MAQFEATGRKQFAAILRAVRADRTLRTYGRLSGFGRVIIADQFRVSYGAWSSAPSLNIHRAKGADNMANVMAAVDIVTDAAAAGAITYEEAGACVCLISELTTDEWRAAAIAVLVDEKGEL